MSEDDYINLLAKWLQLSEVSDSIHLMIELFNNRQSALVFVPRSSMTDRPIDGLDTKECDKLFRFVIEKINHRKNVAYNRSAVISDIIIPPNIVRDNTVIHGIYLPTSPVSSRLFLTRDPSAREKDSFNDSVAKANADAEKFVDDIYAGKHPMTDDFLFR
jgi:hypothetical protein